VEVEAGEKASVPMFQQGPEYVCREPGGMRKMEEEQKTIHTGPGKHGVTLSDGVDESEYNSL
jgi:hypothetical protein